MSKKLLIAFVLTVLLVLPSVAFAQWPDFKNIEWWGGTGGGGWPSNALALFFGPNIPAAFTQNVYTVLQWLIFPFVSLWMIIFGVLSEVRIFRRKTWINGVLAFLIAAIAGPTGGLVYLVRIVFVAYGWLAFLVFAFLLFLGTVLWGWGTFSFWRGKGDTWEDAAKGMKQEIELEEHLKRLERIIKSPNPKITDARRKEALQEWKRLAGKRDEDFGIV